MGKRPFPYARRAPTREPYATVLIVCEGAKTEPNYFRDLMLVHRLSSANIVVTSPGSDPVTIATYALGRTAEFDKIYCVFDGEHVSRTATAVATIKADPAWSADKLTPVVSYPCFEVWLILHFEYSTAPFSAARGLTVGEIVVARLRKHLPQYEKATSGLYTLLEDKVKKALANGLKLTKHNTSTQSHNPSTAMHELVGYLRDLKER